MAMTRNILGINGLGRIGKLSLWNQLGRRFFDEIVVNLGRGVGGSLRDIAHYVERDSTYGRLDAFINGFKAGRVIGDIDEKKGIIHINGIPVTFLRSHRNPVNIGWGDQGVSLVLDTTGQFLDPVISADKNGGALRGHLDAGAEKVVVSAPFKIADKMAEMPGDAITTVMGINGNAYDPRKHKLISNASCTTTCLAHMLKPLIDYFGADKLLTASMTTVHAATGSQQVLDRLPGTGSTDLRKNRSVLNNIILTSTGAAKALSLVIPEMKSIGFLAESVRIPTTTGSLVILVVNFQEDNGEDIRRELINSIYREAAASDPENYLCFSSKQNVSSDIIGHPKAATVIEGAETHTRTAKVSLDLKKVPGIPQHLLSGMDSTMVGVPITKAVIYGWYDNEYGSYVNMLSDRVLSVYKSMR
jgi:glyceraldehyde 3-phosphate dehydrogenase